MKKTFYIALTLILALAATEAFCQEKPKAGWGAETTVDSYQIGVGDLLEITTWKEPDFSRENVLVRSDGKISFPLVNDFPAAGLSPMELKFNLEKALKAYVEHPVVTVTVTNPGSQKFYILGEVMRTGEYPLIKQLTVYKPLRWPAALPNGRPKRKSSSCATKAGRTKFTASTIRRSPKARTSARTSNSKPTIPSSFHKYGTMFVVCS